LQSLNQEQDSLILFGDQQLLLFNLKDKWKEFLDEPLGYQSKKSSS